MQLGVPDTEQTITRKDRNDFWFVELSVSLSTQILVNHLTPSIYRIYIIHKSIINLY